jgi:hypothetical protein
VKSGRKSDHADQNETEDLVLHGHRKTSEKNGAGPQLGAATGTAPKTTSGKARAISLREEKPAAGFSLARKH